MGYHFYTYRGCACGDSLCRETNGPRSPAFNLVRSDDRHRIALRHARWIDGDDDTAIIFYELLGQQFESDRIDLAELRLENIEPHLRLLFDRQFELLISLFERNELPISDSMVQETVFLLSHWISEPADNDRLFDPEEFDPNRLIESLRGRISRYSMYRIRFSGQIANLLAGLGASMTLLFELVEYPLTWIVNCPTARFDDPVLLNRIIDQRLMMESPTRNFDQWLWWSSDRMTTMTRFPDSINHPRHTEFLIETVIRPFVDRKVLARFAHWPGWSHEANVRQLMNMSHRFAFGHQSLVNGVVEKFDTTAEQLSGWPLIERARFWKLLKRPKKIALLPDRLDRYLWDTVDGGKSFEQLTALSDRERLRLIELGRFDLVVKFGGELSDEQLVGWFDTLTDPTQFEDLLAAIVDHLSDPQLRTLLALRSSDGKHRLKVWPPTNARYLRLLSHPNDFWGMTRTYRPPVRVPLYELSDRWTKVYEALLDNPDLPTEVLVYENHTYDRQKSILLRMLTVPSDKWLGMAKRIVSHPNFRLEPLLPLIDDEVMKGVEPLMTRLIEFDLLPDLDTILLRQFDRLNPEAITDLAALTRFREAKLITIDKSDECPICFEDGLELKSSCCSSKLCLPCAQKIGRCPICHARKTVWALLPPTATSPTIVSKTSPVAVSNA